MKFTYRGSHHPEARWPLCTQGLSLLLGYTSSWQYHFFSIIIRRSAGEQGVWHMNCYSPFGPKHSHCLPVKISTFLVHCLVFSSVPFWLRGTKTSLCLQIGSFHFNFHISPLPGFTSQHWVFTKYSLGAHGVSKTLSQGLCLKHLDAICDVVTDAVIGQLHVPSVLNLI